MFQCKKKLNFIDSYLDTERMGTRTAKAKQTPRWGDRRSISMEMLVITVERNLKKRMKSLRCLGMILLLELVKKRMVAKFFNMEKESVLNR